MSDKKQQPGPPRQIQIEVPAELDAVYSNFALITHSASEVIIDFARVLPNAPKAKVHARIILTPMNAKLLHQALGENLKKFEEKYGEIRTGEQGFPQHEERLGFIH